LETLALQNARLGRKTCVSVYSVFITASRVQNEHTFPT